MKNKSKITDELAINSNGVLAEVKQTDAKRKVSAFEYAIMEVADAEEAKKHEPFTKKEETQMRVDKLMNQTKRMRIKHES